MSTPRAILPLFLTSILGCGRGPELRTPLDGDLDPQAPVKDVPVQELEPEPEVAPIGDPALWDRWIYADPRLAEGYRAGESCPPLVEVVERLATQKVAPLSAQELEAWRPQRLFDLDGSVGAGAPVKAEGGKGAEPAPIPPSLAGACLYQRDASVERAGPTLDRRYVLATREGGFVPDRALTRTSGEVSEAVAADLIDRFRSRTFTVGTAQKKGGGVQLTLLDTAPTSGAGSTGPAASNNSKHGWAMAGLAQGLLCAGKGVCAGTVNTRLAMPLVWDPATLKEHWDLTDGGFYGSTGWLAQAIRSEVVLRQGAGPLVLVLPLGWLPGLFREGVDTEVVKWALIDARCQGALVVAAAGNRTGKEPYTTGPILPAAWADLAYEKDWNCSGYPTPRAIAPGEPLVFAAGALDARGTPSAITRPQSIPHLLAYGEHAVVASPAGGPPPMSGTSVSTVVLASAAAVVWANAPKLSAGGVMKALYDQGEPLTSLALDLGPDAWGAEPRALTACRAFDGGVFTCAPASAPPLTGLVPGSAAGGLTDSLHDWIGTGASLDVPATEDVSFGDEQIIDGCAVRCSPRTPSPGLGFVACPQQSLCTAMCEPRVAPQPPGDWCPTCPLAYDGKLVLATEVHGMSHNVVLEVFNLGVKVGVYHLGDILTPKIVRVIPEPPDQFQHIDKALLHRTRLVNGQQVLETSVALLPNP